MANRFEVSEVLYRLAEHVVEILNVAGTGVSVVDEQRALRPVTGINELTTILEATEEQFQEGPCDDAFRDATVVVVEDLAEEASRWPRWAAEARARGVHAVLRIPLRVREESLGSMNIYAEQPPAWTRHEIRIACVLSDMAASYVANPSDLQQSRRTTEQLREAPDGRIIIEQAKGALAVERGSTVDEVFDLPRRHARSHGASLRSVAHAVVHLGLRPAGPHRPRVSDDPSDPRGGNGRSWCARAHWGGGRSPTVQPRRSAVVRSPGAPMLDRQSLLDIRTETAGT